MYNSKETSTNKKKNGLLYECYLLASLFTTLSRDAIFCAMKSIRIRISVRFIILREPAPLFRNNGCATIRLRITLPPFLHDVCFHLTLMHASI